jgi:glycosyltransferase involved in cell wall biosynthesis
MADPSPVDVSVVIPVFQGERTLEPLVAEIEPLTRGAVTPHGRPFRVGEIILVHDGARDDSAGTIVRLAERHDSVRPVWLSRNYGQHPATIAGMACSVCAWVVTLDEDGQQDPRDVGALLDEAIGSGALLVYATPANPPPHGVLRNLASGTAKWVFVRLLGNRALGSFNSFRLVRGDIARAVAAHCGPNVYLDVALAWVVPKARHCPLHLRGERGRASGYDLRRLLGHFWRLVLTSGTRPLRLVVALGLGSIIMSLAITAHVIHGLLVRQVPVAGWTSLVVILCLYSGLMLFSLGIIAEYLGVAVSMAMGRPPYLIVAEPTRQQADPE